MVARTGQSLNATAMPLVQASKPAFVDIATLIQRTYSDKNIILVNSHSFEPKLPLFFNVWYGAGNRTAPITLMVTSEVRPLTVRGAYLKTSNASTAVTDSLGVQIPDHALAHFVIAPYFTRHTCNSIQPHINSMRSRRPYRICFVGCIIKHNSYRNAPSPGFEARKTFIRHMNSSSTRIIDLCEQRHDRSPPQGLDSVYSQCDLCLSTGGDSVTSVRTYDVMASLCLPIITDPAYIFPFASIFPWDTVAFRHHVETQDDTDQLFAAASRLTHDEIIHKRHILSKHVHMLMWNWNGASSITCKDNLTPARLLRSEILSCLQQLERGKRGMSNVQRMLRHGTAVLSELHGEP